MSSVTSTSASSSSGSAKVHTAQADNVHVKSVVETETQSKVSMENAKKITDLMARLGKYFSHECFFLDRQVSFQVQLIFK